MADLNDIINTLIAEANAEGPEGMRRVGETILNRAAIRGIDPAAVVRQPHQFTGYYAPGPAAVAAQRDPRVRTAAEAAWELARQPGDPTDGADHYHADYVDPDWASAMPSTGSYGQHQFYRSRQVPAEALARLLAPTAPTPAMPSAALNARRSPAFNGDPLTPANGRVVSSFPTRPVSASSLFNGDPLTPSNGPVVASFPTARGAFNGDPLTPAPGRVVASIPTRPAQAMTTAQLRADNGQNGLSRSTQKTIADMFNGDPLTPAPGRVVASIPTTPAARPLIQLAQTFAGQDRAPAAQTRQPVTASGVGKAPATRTVQSVPVSRSDPIGSAPKFSDLAAMFAPTVPSARTASSTNKVQDRLPATPGPRANAAAPGPALFGGLDPTLAGPAPTPFSASDAARARAPQPTTKTITERVVNPAWMAAQKAAKVDPIGEMPSWGDFASFAAPKPAAKMPSQYISVTRKVPVAASPAFVAAKQAPVARRAPAAAPLRVVVQRSTPPAQPKSLYYTNPIAFGNDAVSRSGDTSSGNQAEAAAARASGDSWRASRGR